MRNVPLLAAGRRLLESTMRTLSRESVLKRLWVVPPLLWRRRRRLYAPRVGAWPGFDRAVPSTLLSAPGVPRDPEAEQRAYDAAPLGNWVHEHIRVMPFIRAQGWRYLLPTTPRKVRVRRAAERVRRRQVAAPTPRPASPEELTAEVKARARKLGLSACGIARLDPKYTCKEYLDEQVGDFVVVCAMEQNWEAAQTAPSARAEKGAITADTEVIRRVTALATFLQERGHRAIPQCYAGDGGDGILIHYAVEAGLGQLGLNGQLLTPQAGARCRLSMINTSAPLVADQPVDYGIPRICDECRVCVRRCPSGAITARRDWHRGVLKAKVSMERCLPVIAQQNQCAVCNKVCPVQRYGLVAVLDEYERSGQILGKGTEELEAYVFEGRSYGVGSRPQLPQEWFEPPGLNLKTTE